MTLPRATILARGKLFKPLEARPREEIDTNSFLTYIPRRHPKGRQL